eukprot:15429661-Heterocapsa_arctica.AAC.1
MRLAPIDEVQLGLLRLFVLAAILATAHNGADRGGNNGAFAGLKATTAAFVAKGQGVRASIRCRGQREDAGRGGEANVVRIRSGGDGNAMDRRHGIHSPEPHRQDGVTDESAQRTALRNACTGDKRCTNVRAVL